MLGELRLQLRPRLVRWVDEHEVVRARLAPELPDGVTIVDAVATALRYEGFEVEEAATGREALAAVARFDPDLIVLDWMLPDIDGIMVCRQMRARGATLPILMLTARGEVDERVMGLEAGADDYLCKPFEIDELLARINALVRRASGFSSF